MDKDNSGTVDFSELCEALSHGGYTELKEYEEASNHEASYGSTKPVVDEDHLLPPRADRDAYALRQLVRRRSVAELAMDEEREAQRRLTVVQTRWCRLELARPETQPDGTGAICRATPRYRNDGPSATFGLFGLS